MAKILDAQKYGKDALPILNDCENYVLVENVNSVIPCNSNVVFDDDCMINNTSCNNLDFKTSFDIDVSCYSNSDFDNDCTLNSTKSYTSDNTSCNNLDFKTSFDIDVSCNSNLDFDNDCTLNSTKSYTSDNTSCNNLDFKTSFDIDVSCNSNLDFDNDCTLNSTKSYTSDNTSCNNLDFKTSFDIDVSCNSNLDFDNDCTLNSTKSYTSDNTSCNLDSTVSDLRDTIANSLSDISFCSSVNKEHLVLNEVLSHKNCISFNKCISNDDHIDQSSSHEYVVTPSVDKCDIDIERSVIVSDNVSHVNDNHDIDSCIPSIPIIDCDDSVAYSLLSDYDKDNSGISFNKDDTNFIDVNHSFQCSLKPINNEDHGQSDTKSSRGTNKAKMSHGSNLSVLYFNARSIKNKLEEFHARVYLENPDIIAITESWLDDSFNAGEVFPSEYSVFRNDRNTHGGGVALGIKCYLNPVLRPEFLSSNIEIVWAELTTTRGKCLFGVYYRPPSQNKNGLEILDENLCKIQASNKSYELYTLVGDFNIHIDWVSDMNVIKGAVPRTLIDTMNSSGFTQVLKEPTYRTLNGVDHFLDLVFVSDPSFVIDCSSTYNLNGCDHSAVSLLLNTCQVKSIPNINKPVYCLKSADFDKMKCLLINGIDQLCFEHDDIDCIWNSVEGVIKHSIDKSVPKKSVYKFKSLAWMNKDIRKMCTRKKLLYKRAKSSGSEVAWQQFKECSNKVKALVRKSHRDYTYDISVNVKYNPKKFWSYISSLRKDCDNTCFTINGTTVSNPSDIADKFNNHFCSKFDGIYKPLDLSSLPDTPTSHGAPPLSFDSFSVDEVFDALKNLDTSKSPGPDDILPIFLKTCSNELAPVLCKVFNFFVQKGQVPKAWKEANVVPVYKGGVKPKDDVGSYRPVSLTSILCKVLEKLISVRIIKYADEHDILSDNQFGFRNSRNCEQMLVKFFHHVCKSLDDRKCNIVDGIFLDFSSAFDKVDHNLLLSKLHSIGIRVVFFNGSKVFCLSESNGLFSRVQSPAGFL